MRSQAASRPGIVNVSVSLSEEVAPEVLEAVAAAAHESGLPLSHLGAKQASLEQVFAQLTEFAGPKPAAAAGEGENNAS